MRRMKKIWQKYNNRIWIDNTIKMRIVFFFSVFFCVRKYIKLLLEPKSKQMCDHNGSRDLIFQFEIRRPKSLPRNQKKKFI